MAEGLNAPAMPPFERMIGAESIIETPAMRAALTGLRSLLARGVGGALLEGDADIGKTEFCRRFTHLVADTNEAVLPLTQLDFDLAMLLAAISDVLVGPFQPRLSLGELSKKLAERNEAGQKLILLIDRAERLTDRAWDALATLVKTGVSHGSALFLLLVGRPVLGDKLRKPSRAPIAATVSARLFLAKLTVAQSCDFVRARLMRAGIANPGDYFSIATVQQIAAASDGLPGRLTLLAARVHAAGVEAGERPVSAQTASRALSRAKRKGLSAFKLPAIGLAAAIVLAAIPAWFGLIPFPGDGQDAAFRPSAQAAVDPLAPLPSAKPSTRVVSDGALPSEVIKATLDGRQPDVLDEVDMFLMPARRGDTLRKLYDMAYRNAERRPAFDRFLASNPGFTADGRLQVGELISFPEAAKVP